MKIAEKCLVMLICGAAIFLSSCIYKLPELDKYPIANNPVVRNIPPLSGYSQSLSCGASKEKAYVAMTWLENNGIEDDPKRFYAYTVLNEIAGPDNITSRKIFSEYSAVHGYQQVRIVVNKNDEKVVFIQDMAGNLLCWTEKRGLQPLIQNPPSPIIFKLHRPGENGHFLVIIVQDFKKIILDYEYDSGTCNKYVTSLSETQEPTDIGILPDIGFYILTYDYNDNNRIDYNVFQPSINKTSTTSFGKPSSINNAKVFFDSSDKPESIFYNNSSTLMYCENKSGTWKPEKGIFSLANASYFLMIQNDSQFHILQAYDSYKYRFFSFTLDEDIKAYQQELTTGMNLSTSGLLAFYRLQYPSTDSDFLVVHSDETGPTIYLLFFKDYN